MIGELLLVLVCAWAVDADHVTMCSDTLNDRPPVWPWSKLSLSHFCMKVFAHLEGPSEIYSMTIMS